MRRPADRTPFRARRPHVGQFRSATIFIALTAVAVLIQTGILVAFYFLSTKISRQADRATANMRNLLGPLLTVAENLQAASTRLADLGTWWRGRSA